MIKGCVSTPFFIFIIMEELEDIFKTNEFKALPWKQRFWVRVKVAIAGFLSM
jgi:hypothetical protein